MTDSEPSIPNEWAAPPQRNQTWKVVAAVVAFVLICDLAIGAVQTKLSMDLVHHAQIPAIIQSFVETNDDHEPVALFLGNSLTREGIDADAFGDMVFKINPDDTSIVEWRYLFDEVARRDVPNKHHVFLGYAQNQLTDDSIVRPRRLGSQYMNAETFTMIWNQDVTDFGGRCELLLSRVSNSIANAERIRTRVLAMVAPQYEHTAQRLNQAVVTASTSDEKSLPTYDRLQHVVDAATQNDIQLTIVAIPVGETYELEPALLDRLSKSGIAHVDGRHVDGINQDSFPDGYHMDAAAAKLFTAFVREQTNDRLTRE